MAAPTLADFRSRFPEFSTADSAVERVLARAKRFHALTVEGWLLAAAHLLALVDDTAAYDGGAGVVTSETIGPRTIDYETVSEGDGRRVFFASTRYGREFLTVEDYTPRRRISAVAVG